MSAPERFQVGDTVRCVDHMGAALNLGQEFEVLMVEGNERISVDHGPNGWGWFAADRFVLVSRPTPTALDPLVWDWGQTCQNLNRAQGSYLSNVVAWSWFCWWASTTNLAAHFLPTTPAARTRASNGRDVPPATVLVELPVDDVAYCASEDWLYDPRYAGQDWRHEDRTSRLAEACRRALGAS